MFTLFNDGLSIPNPLPLHFLERPQKFLPLRKRHKSVPFGLLRLPIPDDEGLGSGWVGVLEGGEEEGIGYFRA